MKKITSSLGYTFFGMMDEYLFTNDGKERIQMITFYGFNGNEIVTSDGVYNKFGKK